MGTPVTKSYLVYGNHIKQLRVKYNIGFMQFCSRSGLSTRTLARIESSHSKIILDETMVKIMRGFNISRQGLRKKLLPIEKVAEGSFSTRNPIIANPDSTHAKITIYLSKSTHRGVQAYAHKYGCTKNQAVVQVLKDQFHIVEDGKIFERYSSTFDTIARGSM